MSVSTLQSISGITGEYVRVNVASSRITYFYIGSDFESLEETLSDFDAGTSFRSVDAVIDFLGNTKKYKLPSAFLFGDDVEFNDVLQFRKFAKEASYLENIPVLLLSFSNKDFSVYRQLVDEVMDLNYPDDIIKKVKVLSKSKLLAAPPRQIVKPGLAVSATLKRGLDIVLSSLLLLVLLPVFLLIAALIRLESRGPVFYVAKRAGRHYQVFDFIKFRTMIVDADQKVADLMAQNQYGKQSDKHNALFFKLQDDPRVTSIGRFLRNTSLDELPQLINVLKGDMSIVGNRPLPLYEAATLTTDQYAGRFLAPAGITGLWQIKKRGQKEMSVEERINLDIAYAHQSSLMYDLWIIANTPRALVQKESV